jgi:Fe-S cluster biogenesis protein NfuA
MMPIFDFFKEGPASTAAAEQGSAVSAQANGLDSAQSKSDLLANRVQTIVDEIRPFLQSDGGDCELIKVEDNVVYVRLVGACVGCPSSLMTLKAGIENRIREELPEVQAVEMI